MGTILGAHLVQAGHSVVMLARDKRAAEIERDGLRIRGLVEFSIPVAVLRDPSQLQTEVLIVATRRRNARGSEPIPSRRASVVFSIQNGLEKNELLQAAFGPEKVFGALANISGEMLENGEVLFTRNVNIYIGELRRRPLHERRKLRGRSMPPGVRAACGSNILGLEWSKFCAWAGMMAMSIITRAVTWQYLCHPGSARVVAQLVRELGRIGERIAGDADGSIDAADCKHVFRQRIRGRDMVLRLGAQFRSDALNTGCRRFKTSMPAARWKSKRRSAMRIVKRSHGISAPLWTPLHVAGNH